MKGILCSAALAVAFLLGGSNYAKAGFFDPGATIVDQSITLDQPSGCRQNLPNVVVPGYVVLLENGASHSESNWADVIEFNDRSLKHQAEFGTATQFGACDGFSGDLVCDVTDSTANVIYLQESLLSAGGYGAYYQAGDAFYTIKDPCGDQLPPAVPLPMAALMAPAAIGIAALFARKLRLA